jgi:hypothetical protein
MKVQDQFYIGYVDGMVKSGKTYDIRKRWGRSQYNQGGGYQLPSYVYFANPTVQFPIDKLEMYYHRDYWNFLKHQRGNFRKKLEFIDPVHEHITVDVVKDTIENYIRKDNLMVLRLKQEFINTIPYNTTFVQDVREDYSRFCEPV